MKLYLINKEFTLIRYNYFLQKRNHMKFIKTLFILLFISSSVWANETINQELSKLDAFKSIGAKITQNQLIGKNLDLYLVKGVDSQGKAFSIVTDKKGQYLVLTNNVFDVKKQAAIKIPANVTLLKDKELFSFGTGKDIYYVFTDPQCPYCHKFEAAWEQLKDKVTFKIFFFNLDFHKDANAMSRWILSAQGNQERSKRLSMVGKGDIQYKDLKLTDEQVKAFDTMLENSKALGMQIGVQGTPAVFDKDGNSINWTTLK